MCCHRTRWMKKPTRRVHARVICLFTAFAWIISLGVYGGAIGLIVALTHTPEKSTHARSREDIDIKSEVNQVSMPHIPLVFHPSPPPPNVPPPLSS